MKKASYRQLESARNRRYTRVSAHLSPSTSLKVTSQLTVPVAPVEFVFFVRAGLVRAFGDATRHRRARSTRASAASGFPRSHSRQTRATPSSVAAASASTTYLCDIGYFVLRRRMHTCICLRSVCITRDHDRCVRRSAFTRARHATTVYVSRSRTRAALPSVTERLSVVMAALPRRRARHKHARGHRAP
jgi:hypothetical protein